MTELMTWGPLCENKFKPTVFRASHQELPHHTHAIRINKRPHRQRRVAWPRCVYGLVVWAVAAARHAEACLENSACWATWRLSAPYRQCIVKHGFGMHPGRLHALEPRTVHCPSLPESPSRGLMGQRTAQTWGWSCQTGPFRCSGRRRLSTGQCCIPDPPLNMGWGSGPGLPSWRAEGCSLQVGGCLPGQHKRRLLWCQLKVPPADLPPVRAKSARHYWLSWVHQHYTYIATRILSTLGQHLLYPDEMGVSRLCADLFLPALIPQVAPVAATSPSVKHN